MLIGAFIGPIIRNITPGRTSWYLISGLFFHKSLEVGWQRGEPRRFDFSFRLSFTGTDHAGLKFSIDFGRMLFEFNVTDHRHWSYRKDRWLEPGEEEFYDDGLTINPNLHVIHDDGPEPEDCE